ncbi:sensor histidine kinase [Mycolicibacterium austroafricanum]|uniref:sensor histidine kinase n=1 Tax=Mycolicibacterium austroafricanum TaxID=39687 RepID=UPI00055DF809|nr:histidine kinase [Mycolicibacterium austroafricanum]QZY45788.1 two-component sensor histidine kinase [Mycolicibacterium austroafricanum]
MLAAVRRQFRRYMRRKSEMMPGGFSWPIVVSIDVALFIVSAVAILQRPESQWWIAILGLAVAYSPYLVFFAVDISVSPAVEALALGLAWMLAISIWLFGMSAPIEGDFAPVLLGLVTGVIGSMTSMRGGMLAAVTAAGILGAAVAMDRVDTPWLYLSFIGIGWLVGYLMRIQQELLLEQREAQQKLAEHAAVDERRRIAREVHDVIAHSLTVTLLHVTGARRGLQEDRDVDEAVEALEQAERLGRQAMADIRRTVGLLDDAVGKVTPEPGVGDIAMLVDDFVRAGLAVRFESSGRHDRISGAAGLALYRIAQESLANIAKHAPDAVSELSLTVSPSEAVLTVTNRLPVPVAAANCADGRGMRGMRQRVQQLGGTVNAGPDGDGWVVHATIPLDDESCVLRGCGG